MYIYVIGELVYYSSTVQSYVCMYVCMYVCIYVCMYVSLTCIGMYVCKGMYVCMYVCMCVCVYALFNEQDLLLI